MRLVTCGACQVLDRGDIARVSTDFVGVVDEGLTIVTPDAVVQRVGHEIGTAGLLPER